MIAGNMEVFTDIQTGSKAWKINPQIGSYNLDPGLSMSSYNNASDPDILGGSKYDDNMQSDTPPTGIQKNKTGENNLLFNNSFFSST